MKINLKQLFCWHEYFLEVDVFLLTCFAKFICRKCKKIKKCPYIVLVLNSNRSNLTGTITIERPQRYYIKEIDK